MKKITCITLLVVIIFSFSACQKANKNETAETDLPAASSVPTPKAEPEVTDVLTPVPTPASTATPSITNAPSAAPNPTKVPTIKPTAAPSPTIAPTAKPTAAPSPTKVPTIKPTATPKPAAQATPSPKPTITPIPTAKPIDYSSLTDDTVIEIKDLEFKEQLLESLGHEDIQAVEEYQITFGEMKKLKGINCAFIKNIEGLEYAINLESLILSGDELSDISPLENLTNLNYISISSYHVNDITPLRKLTKLTYLKLYGAVVDMRPLENLTELEEIDLFGNHIKIVCDLSNLVNLRILNLGDNLIEDISGLRNTVSLTELWLNRNNITDISPLTGLTNLSLLKLWSNKINNVKPLLQCKNLKDVYLHGNELGSDDYDDLNKIIGMVDYISLSAEVDPRWNGRLPSRTTRLPNPDIKTEYRERTKEATPEIVARLQSCPYFDGKPFLRFGEVTEKYKNINGYSDIHDFIYHSFFQVVRLSPNEEIVTNKELTYITGVGYYGIRYVLITKLEDGTYEEIDKEYEFANVIDWDTGKHKFVGAFL